MQYKKLHRISLRCESSVVTESKPRYSKWSPSFGHSLEYYIGTFGGKGQMRKEPYELRNVRPSLRMFQRGPSLDGFP
jgi:hypothetical protein